MVRRALVFFLVFGALALAWQGQAGSALSRALIERGVVAPAAAVAAALSPNLGIHAAGSRLRSPAGGINIVNGCDGTEALFLLIAGLAVAPIPPAARILGILAGIPVVYAANLVRILVLFHARRAGTEWFDLLHGSVTPVAMVLAVAAYYHVWLRRTHVQIAPR